ncbi:MAG TPA: DUF4830 domain-containing protein [Caproicibacter sp.]|nr:DUF4830 domain-containing protein [Caproicibacter sp.]
MFVLSVKHNRRKTIVVLAVLIVAITAVIVLLGIHNTSPQAEYAGKKYALSAATNEERVAFFKQFGWSVKSEPASSGEVTIPEKFNDVYTTYNNIQKEQGLDLLPYAGKTVEQWIYDVTNYPQQETMRGTILVYNGRVIGGDLSTPQLDGFMTGFDGQAESQDYTIDQPTLARSNTGTLTSVSSASAAQTSSVQEAKKPVSSAIPANAWPTD